MLQEIKNFVNAFITGRVAASIFSIFNGRCTLAAICFSVVGVWGWLHGKDLTSYSVFVGTIQALLVAHSWKEDIAEQRQLFQKNPLTITPAVTDSERGR